MEILREILLTLHLLGMAIIVGGYFTVIRSPKVLPECCTPPISS
jgi:hypothetical protein